MVHRLVESFIENITDHYIYILEKDSMKYTELGIKLREFFLLPMTRQRYAERFSA